MWIRLKVQSCPHVLGKCSIDQEVTGQQELQESHNLQ